MHTIPLPVPVSDIQHACLYAAQKHEENFYYQAHTTCLLLTRQMSHFKQLSDFWKGSNAFY